MLAFIKWETNTATLLQENRLISERVHDVSKPLSPTELKCDVKTTQPTQCHLAGFAQLRMVSLFHLLVGQDLFQSSCEEHVFRLFALKHVATEFGARCAWTRGGCSRLDRRCIPLQMSAVEALTDKHK